MERETKLSKREVQLRVACLRKAGNHSAADLLEKVWAEVLAEKDPIGPRVEGSYINPMPSMEDFRGE